MTAPIRRVVIEVPATTANLGAGYDALGLALDLVNRVEVERRDETTSRDGDVRRIEISVRGQGEGELEDPDRNRFVASLARGLAAWREERPGAVPRDRVPRGEDGDGAWSIRMDNAIPLGRGLGSSGAATIAALVAAAAFTGHTPAVEDTLALAVELEGHADNAAAALLGGLVAVTDVGGRWQSVRWDPPDVALVVFVPELRLATAEMRRVLPASVPLADAVFNVGRVAVGVARLASGDATGFAVLTEDRLHQPYRAGVFPALPELIRAARDAGALGAALSGSGSSVVAFVDPLKAEAVARAFDDTARRHGLQGASLRTRPRGAGATIVEAQ